MRTTHQSTLALLSFAILAAFAFSSCASKNGSSGNGRHTMNTPFAGADMPDSSMPGRR